MEGVDDVICCYLGPCAGTDARADACRPGKWAEAVTIFTRAHRGQLLSRPSFESADARFMRGAPVGTVPSGVRAGGEPDRGEILLGFDELPIGVIVSELDGTWIRANRRCAQMLGYDEAKLAGVASASLTHPDDASVDREFIAAVLAGERETLERDKRYLRSDGSLLWARVSSRLVRDEAAEPLCLVAFLQDLTERRNAENLLTESEQTLRAVIDTTPATISVKDRAHRYTLVNREFEQRHNADSSAILGHSDSEFLPADEVDDVHHRDLEVLDTGRSSLQEKAAVRGGRERVLLVTRFPLRDHAGVIHGVCTTSTDVTDRRTAEIRRRERLECSALIYSALAEHRFVLHGQPIMHLGSMAAVTAELLIRMRESRISDELLAPGLFLPRAEDCDLIGIIDEWVIAQATDLAVAGRRVSVNLSAKTVSDPDHVDRIEASVMAAAGAAERLIFEITETAVADDLDAARDFSMRMRKLGCGISLDDFGVGHGAFTYLRHLPVDYLKIDRQFVRDLLVDEEDRQVVQAIIGVARQFKIKTVAEGVEDKGTLTELRAMGVDYAQGYYTGRPKPLSECWHGTGSH